MSLCVHQGSVTTGDGLEVTLTESVPPPILPPLANLTPAAADVNNMEDNNSVINEEKPKAPEIAVIKLSMPSINLSSFVNNKFPLISNCVNNVCEKLFFTNCLFLDET